jgi:uncharacterized protein YjbJ (UPF0337 family)
MGDRIDELKGKVQQGLGKLTGNKRLEAEGEVRSGTARARRKTKGALRRAGGAVKEGVGKLTGREVTEAEGTAEKLRGQAEQAG